MSGSESGQHGTVPKRLEARDSDGRDAVDAALVWSASEIGCYIFCPQAWHHQRRGTARNVAGARSVEQGMLAHRHIGSRADRVLRLERLRRVMLLVIAVMLVGLLVLFVSAQGFLRT